MFSRKYKNIILYVASHHMEKTEASVKGYRRNNTKIQLYNTQNSYTLVPTVPDAVEICFVIIRSW